MSGEEIEKKYLIREDNVDYSTKTLERLYPSVRTLREDVLENGQRIRQGYLRVDEGLKLSEDLDMGVDFDPTEARLRDKDGKLYFTLKDKGGLSRREMETEINQNVFDKYWPQTKGQRVDKCRLVLPYQNYTAEFDVYTDRDLIVAEVEVPTKIEAKRLNPLGKDVTEDQKYKNKNLAQ